MLHLERMTHNSSSSFSTVSLFNNHLCHVHKVGGLVKMYTSSGIQTAYAVFSVSSVPVQVSLTLLTVSVLFHFNARLKFHLLCENTLPASPQAAMASSWPHKTSSMLQGLLSLSLCH